MTPNNTPLQPAPVGFDAICLALLTYARAPKLPGMPGSRKKRSPSPGPRPPSTRSPASVENQRTTSLASHTTIPHKPIPLASRT
eukprot:2075109-Pyramimonas_sp.AAC.1